MSVFPQHFQAEMHRDGFDTHCGPTFSACLPVFEGGGETVCKCVCGGVGGRGGCSSEELVHGISSFACIKFI